MPTSSQHSTGTELKVASGRYWAHSETVRRPSRPKPRLLAPPQHQTWLLRLSPTYHREEDHDWNCHCAHPPKHARLDERRCTMKALVYKGPGEKTWEDVPDPVIREATDIIVKMAATTICGTDLHILKGVVPEVEA